MPTYEYACRACGHHFEEIHKISDPPVEVCPKCGEKQAQRLISQGNFILKGGGWYTTGGYGTTGTGSGATSSSSSTTSTPKTETSTETKTESKPAETKTETKSEPSKD
ncbi:MAG: zinc ribbon domain-containing protein [Myxococcales bacterium]|nr:zinc ribbon domain-containing protein [Myxococcales bacterium]